jgi:hypothetical protein
VLIREVYPRVRARTVMSNHKIESTALVAANGYHLSLLQSIHVLCNAISATQDVM